MESLNVKNINDEKIFNVIDPNGQGEVVNRIRPISVSINQKAQTINDQTDSTINLAVYWNDTWKSILDLTFDESLRQEYGKLTQDLTNIQKDIDMKQYKDAETKTADFLKYVANLSSKYTAIPEKAVVSKIKNDFIKIKADKNSVKVAISDKLLNFMLKKYAKVNNLDYTKSNECFSTSKFNCLANNYDIYYHSPEIFQKQAYMTVVKDNKVVGSYKVNYDQFSKFASKFMLTPQKLGYSKDRLAGYMKTAEVVMQNIFFDSVDEAKEWQEMVDEKKKEQATNPEGEEETTETTTTETKTEMGEGKSESPVKGDGGLARPSEDFASDEIPESEPRQQEQQGGGQNLGASRRVNLLKKRALKKKATILFNINKDKEFKEKGQTITVTLDKINDSNDIYFYIMVEYDSPKDAEKLDFSDYGSISTNDNDKTWEDYDSIESYLKDAKTYYENNFSKSYDKYVKDTIRENISIENGKPILKKVSNVTKILKKTAKVGYNAEPENMEEEIAIELADELMSAANVALEKAGLLLGGYSGEEQRRQRVDVQKKAIEPLLKGMLKESIQGKVIDLIKEHLTDLNYHTLVSAIEEIMDGKQASKKVKLNKKAEDITEIEENYKENGMNIKYKNLVIKDNAFVQEELKPTLPRIRVDFVIYSNTIPNGMAEVEFHCVVKPSKVKATIPHIERYTINYDVALDNEIKKQLDSILYNLSNKKIQDFCKYNDKGYLVYKYQVVASKTKRLNKKAEEKLYTYDELSEEAKEKARSSFSNDDHSWWYEDTFPEEQKYLLKEKYAQYNVELDNLDIEWDNYNRCTVNLKDKFAYWDAFRTIWVDCAKQVLKDLPMFTSDAELLEDWATEAASDMYFQHDHFEVYSGLNDIDDQDGMELSYKISDLCTKAYEDKVEPILSEIAGDFEDILQKQEDYWYSDDYIKEECAVREILFDEEGNMVKEGKKRKSLNKNAKNKILTNKRKAKKLNKKALYGDVQEQDIVPAKTETKVYLQSEDKGNKKQLPNFSVTVRRNSDDEVVDIIECNTEKEAEENYKYMLSDLEKDCYVSINKLVGKEEYTEIKNSSLNKEESCKKANKNKLVNKKAEEQTIEEKIEQQVGEDGDVKATIGVGDVVTVNFDLIDNSTSEFEKYEEFIGKPMLLMETDKEDINKVIIEETEYPFQRLTIDTDKVELFDDMKGTEIVVEDTEGDEMITTFEELPIVAKQCKIKSIHKAANISKKKANLTKKAINSLEDVAGLIDDILSDYDWYDYADQLEVGEKSHYENILADLQKDEKGTIESLFNRVSEDDEEYSSPKLEELKGYYNAKFGGK